MILTKFHLDQFSGIDGKPIIFYIIIFEGNTNFVGQFLADLLKSRQIHEK